MDFMRWVQLTHLISHRIIVCISVWRATALAVYKIGLYLELLSTFCRDRKKHPFVFSVCYKSPSDCSFCIPSDLYFYCCMNSWLPAHVLCFAQIHSSFLMRFANCRNRCQSVGPLCCSQIIQNTTVQGVSSIRIQMFNSVWHFAV